MRNRQNLSKEEAAIEFVSPSLTQPLHFRELFAREAPVEIDLGCGDGAFLTALAIEKPLHNFLGIERLRGRVRSLCRKAAGRELANVRVLRMDATYVIAHLIAGESVSAFHLMFPDPWPKRRHQRRRAVTQEFIGSLHRALAPNGLLHIATDHVEYFQHIERLLWPMFAAEALNMPFPQSTFEKRFSGQRATIYRLVLRKISPVR
jgi:tRNA (guanine-N7-)-methyltransferase